MRHLLHNGLDVRSRYLKLLLERFVE
jgi:hypothetical protein